MTGTDFWARLQLASKLCPVCSFTKLDFAMSSPSLLDGHVSKQQCKRAVEALLSHAAKFEEKKAETQLFSGKEQNVWLVVNTKVMHPEKKLKPARMCVLCLCAL